MIFHLNISQSLERLETSKMVRVFSGVNKDNTLKNKKYIAIRKEQ